MESEKQKSRGGQDRDVDGVEPGERRTRHVGATARDLEREVSHEREHAEDFRADAGREERELVPRKQVSGEAESKRQSEEDHPGKPRKLAGRSVGLHEQHTEQVHERHEDHQVRGPVVDRSNQPPELHVGHQELDGLVRLLGTRPIVDQQENSGSDLHHEEEERHSPHVVPDRVLVDRNFLLPGERDGRSQTYTLIQPVPDSGKTGFVVLHAPHAFRLTTICSPRTFTSYVSSGRGGGP